jgi:hypothetical protein
VAVTTLIDAPLQSLISDPRVLRDEPTITELARLCHPAAKRRALREDELIEVTHELGTLVDAHRFALGAPAGRSYERLFRTASCEAWLISWGPSTFLGLHDHGGSRGAFEVLVGEMAESVTDLDERAPLEIGRLAIGARRSFGATAIHELWNPTDAAAVSVHAYSPPLSTMNFYAHDSDRYLERVRTETDLEWPEVD